MEEACPFRVRSGLPKAGGLHALTPITVSETEVVSPPPTLDHLKGLRWTGDVPAQKRMNFYTKVLTRYATGGGLKIRVSFEAAPVEGLPSQRLEETNSALREVGLDGELEEMR